MTATDRTEPTGSTTPVVYDPYSYEIHEDPYPTYQRLRDEAPVYHNVERNFYALSRYDDVMEGFRDNERYSSAQGVTIDPAASGPNAHRTMSFLAMDPPQHGRMRGLVSRGFTPRRVAAMEDHIREITRIHVEAALANSEFDFVADIAGKVPMDVISELLGVPSEDRAELRRMADMLVHREEGIDDVPPEGVAAALELIGYYADFVEERRANPTDDMVSALCQAEVDGERLTDDEITSVMFLLVVAGNETTTKLLSHAWYWAWRNPEQLAKCYHDRGRIKDWVEETLRYDTSSQMLGRVTVSDIELHGTTIPAGERVLLLVGAANRDERAFSEPDRFDIDRDLENIGVASFGYGRHFCMGASLARMETRVVLEEILDRITSYDIDADNATRVHSVNVRGFATLPSSVILR